MVSRKVLQIKPIKRDFQQQQQQQNFICLLSIVSTDIFTLTLLNAMCHVRSKFPGEIFPENRTNSMNGEAPIRVMGIRDICGKNYRHTGYETAQLRGYGIVQEKVKGIQYTETSRTGASMVE